MKVERELVRTSTLEAFADKHGLTMKVVERPMSVGSATRFYAFFQGAEVKDGCMLISVSGNGPTEEAAIADYGPQISERNLIVDAYSETRREIRVPRIVEDYGTLAS